MRMMMVKRTIMFKLLTKISRPSPQTTLLVTNPRMKFKTIGLADRIILEA